MEPKASSGRSGMGGGMMGPGQMPMMKMMKDMHAQMMGRGMMMQPKGDQGPASLALNGINARIHKDMDITYTGRTDVDFAQAMIPHHQAAIDMAKVEVAFGKDSEVRKMAEEIIKKQEDEVATLQKWLNEQRD